MQLQVYAHYWIEHNNQMLFVDKLMQGQSQIMHFNLFNKIHRSSKISDSNFPNSRFLSFGLRRIHSFGIEISSWTQTTAFQTFALLKYLLFPNSAEILMIFKKIFCLSKKGFRILSFLDSGLQTNLGCRFHNCGYKISIMKLWWIPVTLGETNLIPVLFWLLSKADSSPSEES